MDIYHLAFCTRLNVLRVDRVFISFDSVIPYAVKLDLVFIQFCEIEVAIFS